MSNQPNFQIIATIKTAWSNVKGSKKTFWAVLCLVILVRIVQSTISHAQTLYPHARMLQLGFLLCILITGFLSLLLDYGLCYIGAQRAMNSPIRFNMLRHTFTFEMLFKIIGNVLLNFLILLLPILLLLGSVAALCNLPHKIAWTICLILAVILMLFLMIRLSLSAVILAVEKVNPWRAVKRSFQATRGHCWKLFWLFILNSLIVIVSATPLGIGLIWTLPYFFINQGVIYQRLASSASLK